MPSQQSNASAICQPTSPAPVRVWIRPGEITNGVIKPGCAALPSQSAHSKPQTTRGTTKLNDKALCPITCPALSLHDSPLRSCWTQSNGSQMVEPGSPRPVTKAGHPASSAVWLSGNWHGCAVLCAVLSLCLCVCVCGVWWCRVINGGILAPCLNHSLPLSLSTLRKRGRSIFIQFITARTAHHLRQPTGLPLPFPLRSWNLSWRPSPPHPGLLD